MKRWWLRLVAAGFLAVVMLFVTLLILPARPPFAFLDGKRPLRLRPPKSIVRDLDRSGVVQLVYSFRADFEIFVASAHGELLQEGFERLPSTDVHGEDTVVVTYLNPGLGAAVRNSGQKPPQQSAVFLRDVYMADADKELSTSQAGPGADWKPRSGWITVIVRKKAAINPFDRFRQWVGL